MVLASALQGTIKYFFNPPLALKFYRHFRVLTPCKAEIMILIYFWQLTVAFSLALAFLSSASEQINNPVMTEKSIRAVIAIIRQVDILNFKSCIIKC